MLRPWLTLALAALVACNLDPYLLPGTAGDGGSVSPDALRADAAVRIDARLVPDSGGGPDVSPSCVPEPETCDRLDNDCDGTADNGFNLQSDPRNCGACGTTCARAHSFGACAAGECAYACLPGYVDLDGSPTNGCEYACIPTGPETCDGADNNCDGQVDEGVDLQRDPQNCGSCHHVCVALHATAVCAAGECDYDRVKGCDPPYTDISDEIPGCEYLCQTENPSAEVCDNLDNDCDGQVDEGAPGGGQPCGQTGGTCVAGHTGCVAGHIVCIGAAVPQAEVCDNADNDCDGQTDEGYDKTSDPRHCGPSCAVCELPFAIAKCIPGTSGTGTCAVAVCLPGHVDLDGNAANGCEYACTFTGSEVCDGLDNDCDQQVDEGLVPPTGLCPANGVCKNTPVVCGKGAVGCDEVTRWRCAFPAGVEADACGDLQPVETLCDGVDGNCNGFVDESFDDKGDACGNGLIGVCASTGTYECTADHLATVCKITREGQPAAASDPTCDGLDDDCDGVLDEDAAGQMVALSGFKIDAYEASRPDATDESEGTMTHRVCSEPGRLPWRNLTRAAAQAACATAGKRLCTDAEWTAACEGAAHTTFPYGTSYDADACNGADLVAGPNDDVLPTGELAACVSSAGVFDLSGNLKEWTAELIGDQHVIRGGAYDSVEPGLTCQFDFVSADESYVFANLGFRCCLSAP